MLNACLRFSTLSAGFFSLIQGVVWAGVCIWGISIYSGTAEYPFQSEVDGVNYHDISVSYLFYITYLRGANGPVIGACKSSQSYSYEAPTAARTYNIMMAYSIISSIWIPTAVMLISGTCLGARGNKAKWVYVPWLILTAANCILDLVAIGYYANDITMSYATGDYFSGLLQMTEVDQVCLGLSENTMSLAPYIIISPIIMTVAACRFVFLWLLNFFFFIFGLQGICAFSKKRKPQTPIPYHLSEEYNGKVREQNNKKFDSSQGSTPWIDFKKAESPSTNQSQRQDQDNFRSRLGQGHNNLAFEADIPYRLSPVVVEVKQEKNNLNEERYAEVEDIEFEMTPEEIHPQEEMKTEPHDLDSHISVADDALSAEEEDKINEVPNPVSKNVTANSPRRVYDAYGNPTEERLTPRVSRIQKIIENQINNQKDSNGGYNTKPFSYTQPLQPQLNSVPKKNDTVRGLEKPPIPVPDYSVRMSKKTSFRTPLHNTEDVNSN